MELKAVVPPEPSADLGMLVRGVIVNNQMHCALGRGLAVDLVEEADELLMPVAAHALADDPSSTLSAANRVVVPCRL